MNTEIEKLRKEIEVLKRTLQPIGSIQCFATLNVPDCWLPCDGRELMARMYPELYQKIGNVFGGVPNKTFCLPDLQGRFIRGWDKEWNLDSGRKFGSTQEDAFQGHGHAFSVDFEVESNGSHYHDLYWAKFDVRDASLNDFNNHVEEYAVPWRDKEKSSYGRKDTKYDTKDGSTSGGTHTHKISIKKENSWVGTPINSTYNPIKIQCETRPKNIALLYCIKVK